MALVVTKIGEGLRFWQATNPDTPPGGWPNGSGPVVGSVLLEADGGIALIDPQVPPDGPDRERFWVALDRDVARHPDGWLAIILTFPGHDRSTREIADRYGARLPASIWIPAGAVAWSEIAHTHTYGRADTLPGGIVPVLFDLPGGYPDAEAALAIPAHRTVVFGDAVIGREAGDPLGPGLRLPPDSTFIGDDDAARSATQAWFGTTFRDVIARVRAMFDPETVLVTHGEPVFGNGRQALAALQSVLDGYRPESDPA